MVLKKVWTAALSPGSSPRTGFTTTFTAHGWVEPQLPKPLLIIVITKLAATICMMDAAAAISRSTFCGGAPGNHFQLLDCRRVGHRMSDPVALVYPSPLMKFDLRTVRPNLDGIRYAIFQRQPMLTQTLRNRNLRLGLDPAPVFRSPAFSGSRHVSVPKLQAG